MRTFGAILICLLLAGCFPNYSDGSRVGVVTKISHKGLIWKSWEGSINQGGTKEVTQMDSNGGAHSQIVANAQDFNVSDPKVIEQVKEAAKTGKRVELVYRQWLVAPPWIDNDHVIVEVKPAD